MNNLTKTPLYKSTVFQVGTLTNLYGALVYVGGGITGGELVTILMATFAGYVTKEGIAKGAESYRDKGVNNEHSNLD